MTERPVLEASDARRVWAGEGLVSEFNAADVVHPADVHAATRLARLLGESDDRVILAAALALRGTRFGHVCVDLETVRETMAIDGVDDELVAALPWPGAGWIEAVAASPMSGTGQPDRPLVLEGSLLYTQRMWDYQARSADRLLARAADPLHAPEGLDDILDRVFPGEPTRQRDAAALALSSRLTVIAGGPGTGKTYTIARIIGAATELAAAAGQRPPLVALAAPTGKAANRLTQQLQDFARSGLLSEPVAASLAEMEAATIHRMLSTTFGRNRFTHHADNPLPHDLVIIDEMSMVPLSMAARVFDATRPEASLILVGDPNQLASIEAGTVLADLVTPNEQAQPESPIAAGEALPAGTQITFHLDDTETNRLFPLGGTEVTRSGSSRGGSQAHEMVPTHEADHEPPLTNHVITLDRAHRFAAESPVADLADAIRRGDADAVLDHLRAGREGISWIDPGDTPVDQIPEVVDPVLTHARRLIELAETGEVEAAIEQLGDLALMCAHRRGPVGVADWVSMVERRTRTTASWLGRWYPGRPVMVTTNDYRLRLFNGDIGVTVRDGDRLLVAFPDAQGVRLVGPGQLPSTEGVQAMTIHKSQGSQFKRVMILVPPEDSRLLTRELLYTAVTRAESGVTLVGSRRSTMDAVARPVARASGLKDRLD